MTDSDQTVTYFVTTAPHPDCTAIDVITLTSPTELSIGFAPTAGMVGVSMKHSGEELLGQRAGLGQYIASGKTFGIPLLAPWANRLEVAEFAGTVLHTAGTPGVHSDGNGLPIHGLLAGCPDWRVTTAVADQSGAELRATLDFTEDRPEFPAFPFPHRLTVTVALVGSTVTVTTAIEATGDVDVPVAFGWHPYFAPPGGDRGDWTVSKPFVHHLVLDERCVPTGEVQREPVEVDVLGDPSNGGRTYDDLFCNVPAGTQAWVEGGKHRITMSYDEGYPYAVLFAPADQPLVAIEPMTAPTDPLAGHFPIRSVAPGETFSATYSIHVTPSGVSA